jgi:hypothetical protein
MAWNGHYTAETCFNLATYNLTDANNVATVEGDDQRARDMIAVAQVWATLALVRAMVGAVDEPR